MREIVLLEVFIMEAAFLESGRGRVWPREREMTSAAKMGYEEGELSGEDAPESPV